MALEATLISDVTVDILPFVMLNKNQLSCVSIQWNILKWYHKFSMLTICECQQQLFNI